MIEIKWIRCPICGSKTRDKQMGVRMLRK
ncbi:MAG: cysteine-rich KTR domain-containing protein [Lachnospiraceae bacterium]|nr:cysteine-rich KTR domain-containing protein [Lachnospiraceae bacterium]